MQTQLSRYAGWTAYANVVAAMLSLVTLTIFFTLEAPQATSGAQGSFTWGTLSDIMTGLAMLPLLLLALILYAMLRERAPHLNLLAFVVGTAGMLGVAVLQLLLVIKVLPFEQEEALVVIAYGVIGIWLVLVNAACRTQGTMPASLAGFGMLVGIGYLAAPILFSALGGGTAWLSALSNPIALAGVVLVYSLMYIGFPIWAFWLGRVFSRNGLTSRLKASAQGARA